MDCLILNHSDWLMFLRQGLTLCVNLDASHRPANDLAQLTMEIKTLEWSPEGEQRVLGPGRHNLTRVTFQSDGLYCAAQWRTDDGKKIQDDISSEKKAEHRKTRWEKEEQMNEEFEVFLFFAAKVTRQLQICSCLCSLRHCSVPEVPIQLSSSCDQDVFPAL